MNVYQRLTVALGVAALALAALALALHHPIAAASAVFVAAAQGVMFVRAGRADPGGDPVV